MSTRTPDATEITLRAIARVRLRVLLEQHHAGGVASLWQIQRAFRPATGAWLRSWSRRGDRHEESRRGSSRLGPSGPSTRSTAVGRSTGSGPTQVRAVDAGAVVDC